MPNISSQSFAHVSGDRKPILAAALAPYQEFSRIPINVIQPHVNDLSSPQAESGQEEQNREVSLSHAGASIAGPQEFLYLLRRKKLGYSREAPICHRRDGMGQIEGNVPALVCKAQETSQRTRRQP